MKNLNFNITVSELAKICNVSSGTVDRALNDRDGISKKTKERILEVAKEYGYIKKSEKKPKLIGIVLFDLYNEYFSELVMHFEAESKKNGYSLVVMFTDKDCKKEIECIKYLYYMGVSSIVLCPINRGDEFENFLSSLKIPIITVGNRLKNTPYVGIDNAKAMFDAAKFVFEKYENVIYFSPAIKSENNFYAQSERLIGFKKASLELGKKTNVITDINELDATLEQYNHEKIAILCSSDYYLLRLLAKYPNVPIMGFDNLSILKFFDMNIATVDGASEKVAQVAIENIKSKECEDSIIEHKIIFYGTDLNQ